MMMMMMIALVLASTSASTSDLCIIRRLRPLQLIRKNDVAVLNNIEIVGKMMLVDHSSSHVY